VYCMENATNGDVDFSGDHSTPAEPVSIARHFCAMRVCSPLSWSRRGGGGNAALSSASTAVPLRSYLSRISSTIFSDRRTAQSRTRSGILPFTSPWKIRVKRHTDSAIGTTR
jgi:hypothetical protein